MEEGLTFSPWKRVLFVLLVGRQSVQFGGKVRWTCLALPKRGFPTVVTQSSQCRAADVGCTGTVAGYNLFQWAMGQPDSHKQRSRKLMWFHQGEVPAATERLRMHLSLPQCCWSDCWWHCSRCPHRWWPGSSLWWLSGSVKQQQVLGTAQGRLLDMGFGRAMAVPTNNMRFSGNPF